MNKILFLLILLFPLLMSSCKDDDPATPQQPNPNRQYYLYIDFWNPSGTDPRISFDEENSSTEIRIDFSQTFAGIATPPNFTKVIIDNVRIIDNNFVNYKIDNITAYEFREDIGDWKIDVEFTMNYEPVGDLNVVLVLDASASLDEDFLKIKEFASDFVTRIFEDNPTAQIGIVDFSDQINSLPLTNNINELNEYIDGIEQGQFTTLYEAMKQGIDMLKASQADGKAILTFTDGTDNNSDPQYTPDYLYNALVVDTGSILINSFTIGLEGNGGTDKVVLQKLAANGGAASFPESISQLESIFEKFSESISNVYNLTYLRNQQVIPEEDPAKLRFVFKASPK
ncbi:MAG: VWA domain-containing protein [Bacteroidales bacterium]|nr:VWA domain-containing protein [Bacteroidales bacterium]